MDERKVVQGYRRQIDAHNNPQIQYREAKSDKCCGSCYWSKWEDTFGIGWCEKHDFENYCGNVCRQFKEE